MDSLWKLWLGAGVLVALVYTAAVDGSAVRPATFVIIGLVSVAVTAFGLIRNQSAPALPWRMAAAGVVCFVLGELAFRWVQSTTEFPPFPSGADIFYLATYPLLVVGIGAAGYRADNPRHSAAIAGALTVGTLASFRMWQAFWSEFASYQTGTLPKVIGLVYPALAVAVVMAASYTLIAATSHRPRLLAVAGVAMFAADYMYNDALNDGVFTLGGIEDFLWLLTFVLVGASALMPAAKPPTTTASESDADSLRRPALAEL